MKKPLALIVHDRLSRHSKEDELDVLVQKKAVSAALKKLGYLTATVQFSLKVNRFVDKVNQLKPDLVFNLTESTESDGKLIYLAPAVLDTLQIPYTGCTTESVFLTTSKLLTKDWLKMAKLPTPQWFTAQTIRKAVFNPDSHYIIKAVWEHASIGIDEKSVISGREPENIRQLLASKSKTYNKEFFVEEFIDGREFNVSVLAGEVLPIPEILFKNYKDRLRKIVDYRAKWDEGSAEYRNTERTFASSEKDHKLFSEMKDICLKCWKLFKLRGYVRIDFRVDKNNRPFVLEINANPCLSPDAGFAAAVREAGYAFEQVVQRIIDDSIPTDNKRSSAT